MTPSPRPKFQSGALELRHERNSDLCYYRSFQLKARQSLTASLPSHQSLRSSLQVRMIETGPASDSHVNILIIS